MDVDFVVKCPYCGAEETGWYPQEDYEIDGDDDVVLEYFTVECWDCKKRYDVRRTYTISNVVCSKKEGSE